MFQTYSFLQSFQRPRKVANLLQNLRTAGGLSLFSVDSRSIQAEQSLSAPDAAIYVHHLSLQLRLIITRLSQSRFSQFTGQHLIIPDCRADPNSKQRRDPGSVAGSSKFCCHPLSSSPVRTWRNLGRGRSLLCSDTDLCFLSRESGGCATLSLSPANNPFSLCLLVSSFLPN